MPNSGNALDWAVFGGTILAAMLLQTAIFGRGAHRISFREALIRTLIWIAVGLGFTGWVYYRKGTDPALTYLIAYLIEESLSIDNLFVFLVIFSYFGIGERHQQRILTWGITGAIFMRAIFIVAGTALLQKFHWMIYVFGAFLIVTGFKLAFKKDEDAVDPGQSLVVRLARKYMRTTDRAGRREILHHAERRSLCDSVVSRAAGDRVHATCCSRSTRCRRCSRSRTTSSSSIRRTSWRSSACARSYFLLAGMMSRFQYSGHRARDHSGFHRRQDGALEPRSRCRIC